MKTISKTIFVSLLKFILPKIEKSKKLSTLLNWKTFLRRFYLFKFYLILFINFFINSILFFNQVKKNIVYFTQYSNIQSYFNSEFALIAVETAATILHYRHVVHARACLQLFWNGEVYDALYRWPLHET